MKEYADYGVTTEYPYTNGGKAYKSYACYESHPVLKLGGGTLVGGSCITPFHNDADIYIGLDHGMRVQRVEPWASERIVQQVLFPVTDMCAPGDPKKFAALVDWVCNQLHDGKKVHAGCIGGHGRTGTLFAALFSVVNEDKDSIETVRSLYCKKAVESDSQINFLHKHFGIKKVSGSKSSKGYASSSWSGGWGSDYKPPKSGGKEFPSKKNSTVFSSATKVWNSVNTTKKLIGSLF